MGLESNTAGILTRREKDTRDTHAPRGYSKKLAIGQPRREG